VAAVRADDPARLEVFHPVGCLDVQRDVAVGLLEARHARGEAHLDVRHFLQHRVHHGRELMLLQMQAERVRRFVLEERELEHADHAFGTVTELPARHHDAEREQLFRHAERRERLQARRMKRAGAQVLEQRRLGFEHQDRNVLHGKAEGRNEAHRPCPHDDHPAGAVRGAQYTLQTMLSYLAFGPTRSQVSIQS